MSIVKYDEAENARKELVEKTLSSLWKVPLYDIAGQKEVLLKMLEDGAEKDVPVERTDSPVLAEYIKSGSKLAYVEWLEQFIEENVPECMKPWGKL